MNEPATIREALFAQMLGEVDRLLKRIEHLPALVEKSEERLFRQATMLKESGDRYGQAVSDFTQDAKTELSSFLEEKVQETVGEQAAAVRQLVLTALETESEATLSPYREIIRKTRTGWFFAHGVTALCASILTALLMRLMG